MKNLSERYRADLERLVLTGKKIAVAIQYECDTESAKKTGIKKEELPTAQQSYQSWYSESLACIRQLLPDRVEDFVSYYKPLKPRKSLNFANYTMSDFLFGATVYNSSEYRSVLPTGSALSAVFNQYKILESGLARFHTSLFDIRALVQADLLDDELSAAEELNARGFTRGAGAIAGVVLESHLSAVNETHSINTAKNATISTLNDALKKSDVIDTATWRFIQRLGDIRNTCDHKTKADPTKDDVGELISGVRRVTKTVY